MDTYKFEHKGKHYKVTRPGDGHGTGTKLAADCFKALIDTSANWRETTISIKGAYFNDVVCTMEEIRPQREYTIKYHHVPRTDWACVNATSRDEAIDKFHRGHTGEIVDVTEGDLVT
jgi:hypothetical protein